MYRKPLILLLVVGAFAFADGTTHDHHHQDDEHEQNSHLNDNEHEHEHEHGEGHGEENTSHITATIAQQVDIGTSLASPKTLHQTITVYGTLNTGPEQLSHVRARFEGLVKSVKVSIGDTVKAGDLLAEIESNVTLKNHELRAPISGQVIQRHANTGEATQDQVLFSIANFETLWAELRIYPAQQKSVTKGLSVNIVNKDQTVKAKINHIIPALEKPYQLARVKVENTNMRLSPGLLIEARVEINSITVPIAIENSAVQSMGGSNGVFIKHDDEYTFTPLRLGSSDGEFTEVLDGLKSGDEYVTKNSYLIKADIEKSEAEHEH